MRSDARKETVPAGAAAETRDCPHCGSSCAPEHQYCPACGFPVATVGVGNDDRLIGRTLPGGYHILDLISVGGMGRVYRAEQAALGRTVAVKIIHPHLLSDESSGVRFMTEARAASQLNHPNSLSVFDFGRTDDGQPYLVMEFLRGRDLARVDYEEGPLGFARIADVLCQVLSALAEAHELGIVHRDLKPENVVLEPLRRGGDFVKVVDFGLAKLRAADTQAPGVTNPGIVCGTPDYMAPEQGRGDPIDGRSDLYAVGVILFQLLAGRLPFIAESPTKVVILHITAPIPDPREIAPQRHIPESFVDVVNKALAKKVADRYQDAFEFSDALKRAVAAIVHQPAEASRPNHGLASIRCTACGLLVPLIKFCGECGARLPGPSSRRPTLEFPLPFVGRDQELAFLQQARHAARGQVSGVCVVGEAGSGKTRLLREFAAFAQDEGDRVAFTGPDRFRAEVGYQALRDAVTSLTGIRVGDPDRLPADATSAVRAALAEVFGWQDAEQRSPEQRRALASSALGWALERASGGDGRVLLVVDDLDEIDGASRNAFGDVLGGETASSTLILGAHRRGFDRGWRSGQVAVHVLGGLTPSAVGRLLGPDSSGAHLEVAGGALPMYVEQVARYTFEGGTSPPARLADLVALRIDMLDLDERRVLQVVAILGDRTSRSAVIEILPRMERLDEALDTLVRRGMVEVNGSDIGVAQPLLREIVLSGIPGAVRRELHEKCLNSADSLAMPSEARALHAYEAGESFQALLLLEQMATRARARGDVESEVFALRRGLVLARREISRGELDDPLRAVIIFSEKLGTCLTRLGSYVDAEGVLREALDLPDPNSTERARLLGALAHVAQGRNRANEALDYVDQAIAIARRMGAAELLSSLSEARQSWTG